MAGTVVQNVNSRVFLIEGRAAPTHAPSYISCLKMGGVSQSFGDITRVECPDPYKYNSFVEVAKIRGASGRPTTSLQGRYYADLLSTIMRLARVGCPVDVQLHIGSSTDPSQFNTFQKALILEEAYFSAVNTEDLGALASGDSAVVNETGEISAKDFYEVRPMTFAEKAASIITNEVVDIIYADAVDCGETGGLQSDGSNKIFALTKAAGGSPTTPADVVYTIDGGSNWFAYDVNSLGAAIEPTALAQVGTYIVVTSAAEMSYHYAAKTSFDGGVSAPSFTKVLMPSSGKPNDIFSLGNVAYLCGDAGYIWKMQDPTAGVTAIESGSATVVKLNAINAYSVDAAVAVGNDGVVIYTTNGTNWAATAKKPAGYGVNLTCVWMRTAYEWWVGTSTGKVFYTTNSGATWTEKSFTGSGSGSVYAIAFATPSVGYIGVQNGSTKGVIHRTYDGGYTWNVMPEGSGSLPTCTKIGALAVVQGSANEVVAGGANSSDGIVILGTAS